jgi:hypothetical protein
MPTMRKYRKIAEECLRLALEAKQQHHRRSFLDLASKRLELAGNDAKTAMLSAEVEALKRPAH